MRKFMILSLLFTIAAADLDGYNYNPDYEGISYDNLETHLNSPTVSETEYFSYSAPENFHDTQDVSRLSAIVRPQRVVFIKNPEKNIFSITAEQLAKQQSLNIFVLNRETNSAGLLSQLQEIRERVDQKPNVQFVKYRTPEDIERAKQAIYNDFESIPGSSKYHEDRESPVLDFDSQSHQLYSAKQKVTSDLSPVIFEIIRRSTPSPLVSSELIGQEYIPPATELKSSEYLPPSLN